MDSLVNRFLQEFRTDTTIITQAKNRRGHVALILPNKTTVSIVGDAQVVQQVLNCLDGINIEYTKWGVK